jgi:hypothetical protein|tara:strand:+ start:18938 stop:20752 length:1815 start_codon:yes stop_codon:yes gene_type:complete
MKRLTTDIFIDKSVNIHGELYDYSETEYINARTKVDILCNQHGIFTQIPSQHFRGQGCPKCTDNYFNLDKFIERCNTRHNNKYDYSKSEYTGSKNKLSIVCPIHGGFTQTANEHLRGRGCVKCGNIAQGNKLRLTRNEIINRAKEIHGELYDYSEVEYESLRTNIKIKCKIHGYFHQRPDRHIFENYKCPLCSSRKQKTQNEFLSQIADVHGDMYDYSKVVYTGITDKINIICSTHGEFIQTASDHLRGTGCKECSVARLKSNTEEFIKKAKLLHSDVYDYTLTEYTSSTAVVDIKCDTHGVFEQRPNNHLQGQGCPKCNKITSKWETELQSFLQDFDIESNNRKVLNGKELDIYIPDKNMAIEFNGNYWHSELNGKDRTYHLNKTNECEKQNIHLLHIFESEWIDKKDIWKSLINSKLGTSNRLYARKCEVREVPTSIKNTFLNGCHLQGEDKSSVKLGLYYNDELASIMTFCKSRYNKNYEWELSRFCNNINTTVVGGASKLLKHFTRNYTPKSIISYSDNRHSVGNLYKQLGFEFLHNSTPNYFYAKGDMLSLKSRLQFQKHKLKDKLDVFDSDLSEWENMKINGYDRIWDCGNSVWGIYY